MATHTKTIWFRPRIILHTDLSVQYFVFLSHSSLSIFFPLLLKMEKGFLDLQYSCTHQTKLPLRGLKYTTLLTINTEKFLLPYARFICGCPECIHMQCITKQKLILTFFFQVKSVKKWRKGHLEKEKKAFYRINREKTFNGNRTYGKDNIPLG